jgi:hypothetical protein
MGISNHPMAPMLTHIVETANHSVLSADNKKAAHKLVQRWLTLSLRKRQRDIPSRARVSTT